MSAPSSKIAVTIEGDYLGKIIDITPIEHDKIRITTQKLYIYKSEPVTHSSFRELYRIWKSMQKEADQTDARLFLVLANVEYNQKEINQSDILPIVRPDGNALIILRDRRWEKVPLEAIGVRYNEAELISSWYTRYIAISNAYKYLLSELDRYRQLLVRYAEFSRRVQEKMSEQNVLITELMKKSVDFQTELQSLAATLRAMESYIRTKNVEAGLFRKAYEELLDKLKGLLDIGPRIIELVNKLATMELEREVEEGLLTKEVATIEKRTMDALSSVERLSREIDELKKEIVESKTATVQSEEEKKEEEEGEESPEEETYI